METIGAKGEVLHCLSSCSDRDYLPSPHFSLQTYAPLPSPSPSSPSTLMCPLTSVANHNSVVDDPMMWSILPTTTYFPFARPSYTCANNRWTLGASDIMFTSPLMSKFFGLGQVIETVRGGGIYQKGVDDAIRKVEEGGWVSGFRADPGGGDRARQARRRGRDEEIMKGREAHTRSTSFLRGKLIRRKRIPRAGCTGSSGACEFYDWPAWPGLVLTAPWLRSLN